MTFEVDTTYTDLTVDQIIMSVGARLTDLKMQVSAKLAEVTLANLNTAINSLGLTSGGSGYSTLEIPVGSAATQPAYAALIIDGWAPYTSLGAPALRRVIVRKVLSQAKVTLSYDRKPSWPTTAPGARTSFPTRSTQFTSSTSWFSQRTSEARQVGCRAHSQSTTTH